MSPNIFYLIIVCLFSAACSTLQNRLPTSDLAADRVYFPLTDSPELLKKNYSFELLDFAELAKSKVRFKDFKIKSHEASEVTRKWIEALGQFKDSLQQDLEFTTNKLPISIKKSDLKKLKEVLDLISAGEESPEIALRKQVEIIGAFNNTLKDPIESKIEILTLPFNLIDRVATYTVDDTKNNTYLRLRNSSFWTERKRQDIDMALGNSTLDLSKFKNTTCKYTGLKKGFGTNLGFKINCFDRKFKVKLREIHVSPFNARIYHRLGYNVPAIHYVKNLKVAYDSRIFSELFMGKTQYARLTVLGKQVKSIAVARNGDIRTEVAYVILKNGQHISSEEFFTKLMPACSQLPKNCVFDANQINPQLDQQVESIVFNAVAVAEDSPNHEFGSWSYDELDHKERTEIRALALVGAWTGNYDLRRDNTKLELVKNTGEIRHVISDPGSGLGNQGMPSSPFSINDIKWTVTAEVIRTDTTPNTVPPTLYTINFRPYINHKVFDRITMPEARWITRQIAGITEEELTEALLSTGHTMSQMLLIREKLISLQQNMLETFKIQSEFPELMARKINRKINYESKDDTATVTLQNGRTYIVEEKGQKIINGVFIDPVDPNVSP